MGDQVDAVVRLDTQVAASDDLTKVLKNFKDILTQANLIGESVQRMSQRLTTLESGSKGAVNVLRQLDIASKGTVQQATNRAGGQSLINKAKSDKDYIASKVANERLNVEKQIAKSAADVLAIARATQANDQKSIDLINLKNLELRQTVALQRSLNDKKSSSEVIESLKQQVLLTQDKIAALKQAKALEAKGTTPTESKEPDYLKRFKAHGGADILMIQARILAGYKILQGAYQSVGFVTKFIIDFDASLANLQAITQTTNAGMTALRNTLIEVSKESKFSAVELSDAALTMAQAGLSTDQIRQSIGAVSTLATAAGTDLATAVDVVTSAMNVFNMQASNTTTVANQMTAALNQSKLNMTQLQLAIQYASNIAADSNIPFSEMIASFGAIADAGIRSGSSIGTGYRQLILDLKDPSEKLITRLAQLGLGLKDIDVDAKGLTGVLKTLADAGFTTSDAMKTMEVRGASIFSALSGNLDSAEQMRKAILTANDAVKAQQIQMNSLANIGSNLAAVYGALAADAFEPLVNVLKSLGKGLAEVGKLLSEYPTFTKTVVTAFSTLIGGGILVWAAKLVYNFIGLTKVLTTVSIAVGALSKAFTYLQLSAVLGAFINPVGAAIAALAVTLGVATAAWYAFSDSEESSAKSAEEVQTALDKATGKVDQYSQAVDEANNFLDQLASRATELNSDQNSLNLTLLEAQQKFNGLTDTVINTTDSYEQLLKKVREIRDVNFNREIVALQVKAGAISDSIALKKKELSAAENKARAEVASIIAPPAMPRAMGKAPLPPEIQQLVVAVQTALKKPDSPARTSELYSLRGRVGEAKLAAAEVKTSPAVDAALANLDDNLANVSTSLADFSAQVVAKTQTLSEIKEGKLANNLVATNQAFVDSLNTSITKERQKLDSKTSTLSLEDRAKSIAFINSQTTALQTKMDELLKQPGGKLAVANLSTRASLEENVKVGESLAAGLTAEMSRQNELQINEWKASFDSLSQKLGRTDSPVSAADKAEFVRLATAIASKEADNKIAKGKDDILKSVINSGGTLDQAKAEQDRAAAIIRSSEMANAQADIDRVLNKQGQHVRQFDEETLTPLETAMTRFKDNVAQANLDFENQKYAAEAPRRALEAKQAAQNSFENRGRTTDSQRELTQRALDRLDTEQMKASLIPMLTLAENLKTQIATARAELDAAKADQAQYASAAAAANDNDVRGNLKKKADRAASSAQQLGSEILGTTKQLDDLQRQIVELKLQLAERSKTQEPSGLGETVSDWLRNMQEKLTGGDSFFKQIDAGLTETFNSANSSLSTMIKDTVTGTKSMKEAFRDFGVSVVDTMMNVAAQMAANSILSSLVGSAASAFGGTPTATTPNAAAGTFNYNLSGQGFSSGGMVGGGVPGRDSVPAMLMPGEFVIKRSAVQALGADTLHQLNNGVRAAANSNAAVAGRAPSNDGGAKSPVNIYIVDKGSVPALGPNDVVAMVSDNIARGGQIKQLIKQVMV